MKVEEEVDVPPGEVMLTVPVEPLPTVAMIELCVIMTKEAAGVPPKLTEATLARLLPLMVTTVPAGPEEGEKEDRTGATGIW